MTMVTHSLFILVKIDSILQLLAMKSGTIEDLLLAQAEVAEIPILISTNVAQPHAGPLLALTNHNHLVQVPQSAFHIAHAMLDMFSTSQMASVFRKINVYR